MTIKTDSYVIGSNADDTRNFLLDTDLAGALRIRRKSDGSGGTLLTIDSAGRVDMPGNVITQANQTPLPGTASLLSFAHGLGALPASVQLELVCLTADIGYSVGDVVYPFTQVAAGYVSSFTPFSNLTTVGARTGATSAFLLTHNITGALSTPTAANWAWRFKVRAK